MNSASSEEHPIMLKPQIIAIDIHSLQYISIDYSEMGLSISLVLCRNNIAIEKNETDILRTVKDSAAWTYKEALLSQSIRRRLLI